MLELDRIICGDCLEELRALPDGLVDCCITSPPLLRFERLWRGRADRLRANAGSLCRQAGRGIQRGQAGAEAGRDALAEFGRFLLRI